jgi:hypothetical protein
MMRLALILCCVFAAPTQAQWSPPARLAGSTDASAPHIAISQSGAAMTAWTRFTRGRPSIVADGGRTVAADADWLAGPVTYGRGHFALAFTDFRQRRLDVVLDRSRRRIASGRRIAGPSIAANLDGDLAVAWFDDRGTRNDEVWVAVRRAGHRFGRPMRVAREAVRSVSVAVGVRGDMLIAWNTAGKVRTRFLRRGNRGLNPVDTIRSREAFNARLRTRVAPNGRAVVGWTAAFRSEGGGGRPTHVEVATRPSGARRFRAAQLLFRGEQAPVDDGSLEFDDEGRRAAWTQDDGVMLSEAGAGGRFGPAAAVAPPDATLQDVASTGSGPVIAWTLDGRLFVDGVAVSDARQIAHDPDLAIDPRTGRPTVVWAQDFRIMTSTRG